MNNLHTIYGISSTKSSVVEIAKYCPKMQSLYVRFDIAEDSLLALSTYCLLLKELEVPNIPIISTEQIAIQCAHIFSCIHCIAIPHKYTLNYGMVIPYLTELQKIHADGFNDSKVITLFSQYFPKLEINSNYSEYIIF